LKECGGECIEGLTGLDGKFGAVRFKKMDAVDVGDCAKRNVLTSSDKESRKILIIGRKMNGLILYQP
jgi:hypothetical protein